jgi:hypothetical protein
MYKISYSTENNLCTSLREQNSWLFSLSSEKEKYHGWRVKWHKTNCSGSLYGKQTFFLLVGCPIIAVASKQNIISVNWDDMQFWTQKRKKKMYLVLVLYRRKFCVYFCSIIIRMCVFFLIYVNCFLFNITGGSIL